MSNGISVVEHLKARLERITIANGFSTNAGDNLLFVGRDSVDTEDHQLPALVLHVLPPIPASKIGDNDVGPVSELLERDFTVEIFTRPISRDQWFDQSETIYSDIKKAVYAKGPDVNKYRDVGIKRIAFSAGEIDPPKDGQNYVAVSVTFSVTYIEKY